jgi:hypothetical protein
MTGTGMVSISTNGSTISIGAAETPKSYFANIFPVSSMVTNTVMGASTVLVEPFVLPYDISVSYIRIPALVSLGSNTVGTTANTTLGLTNSYTYWANIYSLGTGANSQSLQYLTGSSLTMAYQVNASVGAASNNQTVGHTLTYGVIGGTSSSSTTYNVNAASIQISTTHLTNFNSQRWLDIPLAISLSGGAYWLGLQRSTTQSTVGSNIMSTVGSYQSIYVVTQHNSSFAIMGVSSNASTDGVWKGLGGWSTNTNGTTSSSMGLSSISTIASQPLIPFQLIRQA